MSKSEARSSYSPKLATHSRWDKSAAFQELFSFLGIGTKQRDLPVDSKKLVIRLPIKEKINKDPKKPNSVLLHVFLFSN